MEITLMEDGSPASEEDREKCNIFNNAKNIAALHQGAIVDRERVNELHRVIATQNQQFAVMAALVNSLQTKVVVLIAQRGSGPTAE